MDEEKEIEQEEVLPQTPEPIDLISSQEQTVPDEEAGSKKGSFDFNEYLYKMMLMKRLLPAIVAVIFILFLVIMMLSFSGGKSYDYSTGKGYIEGNISEDELIAYLMNMQYCDSEAKCKKSASYQFYSHFKAVYDDYLTDKEVTLDTRLLIATLSYYRSDEEMFQAINEIDLLADAMVEAYEVEVEDPKTHEIKIVTKYRINLDRYKIYIVGTIDGSGGSGSGILALDEFKYFAFHESGSNYGQVGGDRGHAYGFYQFDNRYALQPFLQQCYQFNPTKYAMFEPFLTVSKASLQSNQNLYQAWREAYNQDPEEFARLQDEYEYNNYYLPVENFLRQKGIDISSRRDVIKGLVCGISNLMGSQSAANKIMKAGVTNTMTDEEFARAVCGEMIAHPPSSDSKIAAAYTNRYREELKTVLKYLSQPAREE